MSLLITLLGRKNGSPIHDLWTRIAILPNIDCYLEKALIFLKFQMNSSFCFQKAELEKKLIDFPEDREDRLIFSSSGKKHPHFVYYVFISLFSVVKLESADIFGSITGVYQQQMNKGGKLF